MTDEEIIARIVEAWDERLDNPTPEDQALLDDLLRWIEKSFDTQPLDV